MLPNRNIASRLPIPPEAYSSYEECNPLTLLEKLADHPNGNELLESFREFYQEVIDVTADKAANYTAFPELDKLRARYPEQMELKLLGTHEKYVICDRQFALLGSHNVLSSLDTLFAPRETGWKTSDRFLIEEQIEDFINAPDLKQDPGLWSEFKPTQKSSERFSDIGDPKLIAEAMKVVRQRGIVKPPFFKEMKNSDIQTFIEKYSKAAISP